MKKHLFGLLLGWTLATALSAQNLENIGKEKPVKLGAGFSLQADAYNTNIPDARQAPFTWIASGSPVVSIYGLQLPFSFSFSNHNRSFQQPFNQFGVTPTWRWVKGYLGHNYVRFSPYTLAGHRFLGVGAELTPGKFRFGAVWGRFQKAVAPDSLAQPPSGGQYWTNVPVPAFSRYGYSVKLGVGSRTTFFDLIYFKAKDRSNNPLGLENLLPAEENAVIGASSQITLFKRLSWKGDVGLSAYTGDQSSDTIATKDWAFEKMLRKILLPRSSTQLLAAGETSLGYKDKHFGMKLLYKRIDPYYRTMGSYFFQNDLEMIALSPSLNLRKGRFRLSGSIGSQRNNLLDTKARTTRRLIASANVSAQFNKAFGVDASYGNFGISQRPRPIGSSNFPLDTLRLAQVSQQFMVAPRLQFVKGGYSHFISMSVNRSATADLNPVSAYPSDMQALGAQAMYNLSWGETATNVSAGLIYQKLESTQGAGTSSTGFNFGCGRGFHANKFRLEFGGGWFGNRLNGQKNGSTQQVSLNFNWQTAKNQAFFAGFQLLHNHSEHEADVKSFTETYLRSGWNIQFGQ